MAGKGPGFESLMHGGGVADGDGAEGEAVVALIEADDLGFFGFTGELPVLEGEFEGGFVGGGAVVGEEGAGESWWGYGGEFMGEEEGLVVASGYVGGIGEFG